VPIYQYTALAPGGDVKKGVIDADTARDARQRLRKENLLVTDIAEGRSSRKRKGGNDKGAKPGMLARIREARAAHSGPTGRDLELVTAATRQLGTMLGSGIPLTESLRAMIEQAQERRTETVFREIREAVNQGASLADALEQHPGFFTDLYVNMVRAGEATGNVDVVLSRLADYLQYQRTIRRKVVSALTYPVMMICLGFLVVTALLTFVVPQITEMLEDTGQALPTPTRILIAISDGFRDYWLLGAIAIAILSFFFERIYKKNEGGRLKIDRFMLKMPVLGDVLLKQAVSRFTRTLSTLLQSGVNAVQSLEITRNVIQNRVVSDATEHIRSRIVEGTDISTPLRATEVFPAVVTYMVAVGEQAGELEQMLDRIADSYDEEIEIATERMTSVLEPIMIIGLAIVVGFIVISIVLPILQVGQI
jgi:general secretion pathway protein F